MASKLALLLLLPVSAFIAFGIALLLFYRGGYEPPPSVDLPVEEIAAPKLSPGTFVDSPVPQVKRGLLLVDLMHANAFAKNEIITLSARVAGRGYEVEFAEPDFAVLKDSPDYLAGGPQGPFSSPGPGSAVGSGGTDTLEEKLRRADSFLVVLPQVPYSEEEAALVEKFVRKGGKLLLVSDPTRTSQINTLAARFGLEFRPDYLYNQEEYDLNFQNIIVREFQPEELTLGLGAITLYAAGSIRSSGTGLAIAGAGTRSSVLESADRLYPIAEGDSRNVLAIADFTFMVPPQNSLLDNDRLISNIADYLTSSQREYDLADFPHFYETDAAGSVDILLGRPSLWNIGTVMKDALSSYRVSSQIRGVEDLSRDTLFLGLYEDALSVSQYLQAAGVRIDDALSTPFAEALDPAGTSVMVLDRNQDRHVLIVLAHNTEALYGAVANLLTGEFRGDLVTDFVGVSR